MTELLWENIEKYIDILIFIDFERWNFSNNDFGKYRGHT